MADAESHKGGFHFQFSTRNFEATPMIRLKPRPFPSVLERNFLPSLSIDLFLTEIVAKAC